MADPALTCIAIDDEPFALKLIAEDIGKISFLRLANVFSSASLAKPFLEQNQVDLIFLDISMLLKDLSWK
jgi:two-component SAPR family response regulator